MRNKVKEILENVIHETAIDHKTTKEISDQATDEIMRLWVEYADCLIKDSQEKDARITDLETRVKEAHEILKELWGYLPKNFALPSDSYDRANRFLEGAEK